MGAYDLRHWGWKKRRPPITYLDRLTTLLCIIVDGWSVTKVSKVRRAIYLVYLSDPSLRHGENHGNGTLPSPPN